MKNVTILFRLNYNNHAMRCDVLFYCQWLSKWPNLNKISSFQKTNCVAHLNHLFPTPLPVSEPFRRFSSKYTRFLINRSCTLGNLNGVPLMMFVIGFGVDTAGIGAGAGAGVCVGTEIGAYAICEIGTAIA